MSRIAIKLAALGQDGLTFADGDYDLDRYRQVSELAAELLAAISGRLAAELVVELRMAAKLAGLSSPGPGDVPANRCAIVVGGSAAADSYR